TPTPTPPLHDALPISSRPASATGLCARDSFVHRETKQEARERYKDDVVGGEQLKVPHRLAQGTPAEQARRHLNGRDQGRDQERQDRKSTRLNSSHGSI